MSGAPLSAAQRLVASRERMRSSMSKPAPAARSVGSAGGGFVMEALQNWWAQQPLRLAGLVAVDAAKVALQPLAQRHPIALVAGAAVLGALLVWARPWRGLVRPALLAGLLPQLLSKAVAHLPLESWLAMYSSMNKQPARPADTAGAQARKTAPAPTAPPPHAPLH